MVFYSAGTTPALTYAKQALQEEGIAVTDYPAWNTGHLLLDVPSFRPGNTLNMDTLLSALPKNITIWGGILQHPALDGYRCMDLLKDEGYLLENAAITADCAISLITPLLKRPWPEISCLIIGWGRIGKYLAASLNTLHSSVTVAARKKADRQTLQTLGIQTVDMEHMRHILPEMDLIINTAPAVVLKQEDLSGCEESMKVDLASSKGILSEDVIWARGLPGIHAPERSGRLIAKTILRILKEEG